MTVERPPEHVQAAFGLTGSQPAPLSAGWEDGWRCGEVVLSMVADHPRAAWSAKVRETLFVDGVRLARPVRSTDGRYVVAGGPTRTWQPHRSRAMTRWSLRRCGCTSPRPSWSVPAS